MSRFVERYRSFLRPGRRKSDMFLVACLITFALIGVGSLVGIQVIRLVGLPRMIEEGDITRIVQGQVSLQELTGAPDYLSFASLYLGFVGIWIVFALVMAIFPASRKMLGKLLFVRDKRSLALFGIGALLGFGINSACVVASVLLGNVSLHFAAFEAGPFFLLLFAVFIQSGAEEVASRLFLYQKLARRYRHPVVPIVVSAAFFALLHGPNPGMTPVAFVQILVIRLLFAVLVCYYDALGACIAMHTMWNFTQNIIFGLPNSGVASLYSVFKLDAASSGLFFDPVFGVEGSIGAVILLVLVLAGLIAYAKKRDLKPHDLWSDGENA